MAGSLTALPALLVRIGHRAERRAARRARRGRTERPQRRPGSGRRTGALLRAARRRPAATLVVSVLGLLALAVPALGLTLVDPGKDTFSRGIPAMQAYDRLTERFPELLVTHDVVARGGPGPAGEIRRALAELGELTRTDPLFATDGDPVLGRRPDQCAGGAGGAPGTVVRGHPLAAKAP